MYKDSQSNISVCFTNYIKQGALSSDQNLLDEEFEENITMALVGDSSSVSLEEMREMLDNDFEKLVTKHNRDYDIVMKIYHEMYNLDYLDDIVKEKKKTF